MGLAAVGVHHPQLYPHVGQMLPGLQIIAVSEGYTSKSSCMNGIESVRKTAADADIKVKE